MLFWLAFWTVLFTPLVFSSTKDTCDGPLGAEDGRITDVQFTASSERNKWHGASYARLNRRIDNLSWCSTINDTNPWLKVVLSSTHNIRAVAIQGRNGTHSGWYVTKFKIMYKSISYGSGIYREYSDNNGKKVFDGPSSKNEIVKIPVRFQTGEVLIKPIEWYPKSDLACLRLELYGCEAKDYCQSMNCSHFCKNYDTSARCMCRQGYNLNADNRTCSDINECDFVIERRVCDLSTTTCRNTQGSYACDCLSGMEKQRVGDDKCRDIDECADRRMNNCQQKCINKHRSYECACFDGFRLNKDNTTCTEIDECTEGIDGCDRATTTCHNLRGSYMCKCNAGLKYKDQMRKECININECLAGNGGCDHICNDTFGSYHCLCRPGTYLHANGQTCSDIDECKAGTHDCKANQKCINKYEGFNCKCYDGYIWNPKDQKCEDIDECQLGKPCSHGCSNTIGSYQCHCPQGYVLNTDKKTCIDFDECKHQTDDCDAGTSSCSNTIGSYECRCLDGFAKDKTGKCTAKNCPAIDPIPNGYVTPPECGLANTKKYKDVCTFKCNAGYELTESSTDIVTCSKYGLWSAGFRSCQPIRCPAIQLKSNMQAAPRDCATKGGQYNQECQVYCTSGHRLVGLNKVICTSNGVYDGSLDKTECIADKTLTCPKDLKITLPLGAKDMRLPLEKLTEKLNVAELTSEPKGVLTGEYRFAASRQSQSVTLRYSAAQYSSVACTFHVTVEDKEPPSVVKCPPQNIYVTLNNVGDTVTWPEPIFRDNVALADTFSNLKNGEAIPEQVYYVYYSANDAFLNKAVCRFFVHVKANYCVKEKMPGGDGASVFVISNSGDKLKALLTCHANTMFTKNVTLSIFECNNGNWHSNIPDCAPFSPKLGATSCPAGHVTVLKPYVNTPMCVKCPRGTMEEFGECKKCTKGTYQDGYGATQCVQCPQHTTSDVEGAKDISSCQAMCQPGQYSMTGLYGSTGCDRCPEGSYQDLHGQKSCKLCPQGGKSHKGSRTEDDCKLPARVSSVSPSNEVINAKAGDVVTIDCYGTGSPRPFMKIEPIEQLPPANFRGTMRKSPLPTGNRHISGIRLIITGVTKYDTNTFRCSADNKSGNYGGNDHRDIVLQVE